ncbi:MAG: TetR/AcrR family transcriptional regulator [Syntrophales bacterium]|jgi:AcrR family transcriptional regulator|nr:TetR/AcrR family transcriptional regulator [Syntrophales bacterium]MDY0044734.1 TetR/AcrR family transcriptional regulator [Syntrophales bacterium]
MVGPEKRRKREKEQRKKAILKAAKKLFVEHGFKPVTVASIAKKAELSKGAIYLYFRSKEEIYAQILLQDIESFHKKISLIFQSNQVASNVLFDFADAYIDIFLNQREQFRILMNFMLNADNLAISERIRKQIIREMNRTISIIERILLFGVETEELSLPKSDIRKMRNVLWGLLNGVISLHLFVGNESMREQRIRSNIKEGIQIIIQGLKTTRQEVINE